MAYISDESARRAEMIAVRVAADDYAARRELCQLDGEAYEYALRYVKLMLVINGKRI